MPPFTLRHLCLRIGSPQNGQDAALLEISLPQVGHWIKFAIFIILLVSFFRRSWQLPLQAVLFFLSDQADHR